MAVVLLNLLAIAVGSVLGSVLNRHIRQKVLNGIMTGISVVIVFVGASGVSMQTSAIALLIAFVFGAGVGYGLDLDGKLNRFSARLEARLSSSGNNLIGPGMQFFIVSCSGAYTVNACFFAGMGDTSLLYTKIGLDLIVSLAMSSTLGIGVITSIVPQFLFMGALILLSHVLSPLMTENMTNALATAGSLLAVLIGTNMLGATKIRIVNLLPAVVFAPFAVLLVSVLPL